MVIIFILVISILALSIFIDIKRKKNNHNPHIPTNPNVKSGEDSNYMMGDNKDTGGFN